MSKNIAPRYLRKLKDGQWFFFKFKEPHPIYGFYAFGYKHPKSDLVIPSNNSRMLLSEFEISYFTPCSEKVAIRLKKEWDEEYLGLYDRNHNKNNYKVFVDSCKVFV